MSFEIHRNDSGRFIVFFSEDEAYDWYEKQPTDIQERLHNSCFNGYMNAFLITDNDPITIDEVITY